MSQGEYIRLMDDVLDQLPLDAGQRASARERLLSLPENERNHILWKLQSSLGSLIDSMEEIDALLKADARQRLRGMLPEFGFKDEERVLIGRWLAAAPDHKIREIVEEIDLADAMRDVVGMSEIFNSIKVMQRETQGGQKFEPTPP